MMKRYLNNIFRVAILVTFVGSESRASSVEIESLIIVSVQTPQIPNLRVAAVVPTEAGQIGINPPPPASVKGSIGVNTQYLTEDAGTTKWIGPDPSFITIATTTITEKGSAVVTATVTKGVSAIKNAGGGIDILLSPAIKAKLEKIASEVTPCTAKLIRKRGGACGLADYVQRVGADEELSSSFSRPLTDQVWREIDEGYEGPPGERPGWEGEGTTHEQIQGEIAGQDEGYYGDSREGFYEGAEGAEGSTASETTESIIFSSAEEAAAIAEGVAGAGGSAELGSSTLTVGSFLAMIWNALSGGGKLDSTYQVPKESIHKVTKTKSKTKTKESSSAATTTSSSSCPTGTILPDCGNNCVPTVIKDAPTQPTAWACSKGKSQHCRCNPESDIYITYRDEMHQQALWEAIDKIIRTPPPPPPPEKPKAPTITCPLPTTDVPSEFIIDSFASFCALAGDLSSNIPPTPFDIYGHQKPILGRDLSALVPRSPPDDKKHYVDYKFFLHWTRGTGDCLLNAGTLCPDSFNALKTSNCRSNHPMNRLFPNAKIDVGCGEFGWLVETPAPPTPPAPLPTIVPERIPCPEGYCGHPFCPAAFEPCNPNSR